MSQAGDNEHGEERYSRKRGQGLGVSGDRAVDSDAGAGELTKRRMRTRRRTCANGGLQKGAFEGRGRHRDRELLPGPFPLIPLELDVAHDG